MNVQGFSFSASKACS